MDTYDRRFCTGHGAKLHPWRFARIRWEGEPLHVFRVIAAPISGVSLTALLLDRVRIAIGRRAFRKQSERSRCRRYRFVAIEMERNLIYSAVYPYYLPLLLSPCCDPLMAVFLLYRPRGVQRSARREGAVRVHEVEKAELGYAEGSSSTPQGSQTQDRERARRRHVEEPKRVLVVHAGQNLGRK